MPGFGHVLLHREPSLYAHFPKDASTRGNDADHTDGTRSALCRGASRLHIDHAACLHPLHDTTRERHGGKPGAAALETASTTSLPESIVSVLAVKTALSDQALS